MILANGFSPFPIKRNLVFVMVLKVYLNILLIVLFYATEFLKVLLADQPFAKALRFFETCVLVNNNLCGKLFSSLESPTTFDERFKVTLVLFFIVDFNLFSCGFDYFTFNVLY